MLLKLDTYENYASCGCFLGPGNGQCVSESDLQSRRDERQGDVA